MTMQTMTLANKLEAIYDEMRSRQLKAIREAGSFRSDPYFVPDSRRTLDGEGGEDPRIAATGTSNGEVDERRCFAISSVIDESVNAAWTEEYRALEERLRDEFGEYGVLFSQTPSGDRGENSSSFSGRGKGGGGGQLHWTLMQLVGFPGYDAEVATEESKFTSDQYLDCIRDSLTVGGLDTSIDVTYIGVIAVSTGLLMVGVPSSDVNVARDAIRDRLSRRGLPLQEPFVNDIVHSTIFRVAGDPSTHPADLHARLLDLAAEFEHSVLGMVTLDRFQVGSASWRMLREEVAATPPLRMWTLSSKTPREHYDSRLCSKGGANHYTVSGASGNNLAMELKQNLSRGVLAGSKQDLAAEDEPVEFKITSSRGSLADLVMGRTSPASPGKNWDEPTDISQTSSESYGDDYAVGEEYFMPIKCQDPAAVGSPTTASSPTATGRATFTVSGASGTKLAMELRRALSQTGLVGAGAAPGKDEASTVVGVMDLRKQLEEEGKALQRLYNMDFY